MTTIAYCDGIMAADSQCSGNITSWGETSKLYSSPNGWIGAAAGDAGLAAEFGYWLSNVANLDDFRAPYCCLSDIKIELDGLLVSPAGVVWCWTGRPRMFKLDAAFTAIGSGASMAMGAMAMGASAERAVQIAAQFDVYTGGKITTLSIRPSRPTEEDQA